MDTMSSIASTSGQGQHQRRVPQQDEHPRAAVVHVARASGRRGSGAEEPAWPGRKPGPPRSRRSSGSTTQQDFEDHRSSSGGYRYRGRRLPGSSSHSISASSIWASVLAGAQPKTPGRGNRLESAFLMASESQLGDAEPPRASGVETLAWSTRARDRFEDGRERSFGIVGRHSAADRNRAARPQATRIIEETPNSENDRARIGFVGLRDTRIPARWPRTPRSNRQSPRREVQNPIASARAGACDVRSAPDRPSARRA